jgi:pyruvate/2-oxoglutarate dehydrogenase complex dihydrolipoamide dehydrogenase (E3) component
VGCIPSKALLESSHKYEVARHELGLHGVKVGGVELDPHIAAAFVRMANNATEVRSQVSEQPG